LGTTKIKDKPTTKKTCLLLQSALCNVVRLQRVVHAHPLAGAERRLHDPLRPLTHDRLLYVIQRPLGRIASMPATGQEQP